MQWSRYSGECCWFYYNILYYSLTPADRHEPNDIVCFVCFCFFFASWWWGGDPVCSAEGQRKHVRATLTIWALSAKSLLFPLATSRTGPRAPPGETICLLETKYGQRRRGRGAQRGVKTAWDSALKQIPNLWTTTSKSSEINKTCYSLVFGVLFYIIIPPNVL